MSRVGIGVVLLVVVGALLNPPVTTQAEPNPYGRRSSQTTIVLQRDGSYDVTLVQAQTLVGSTRSGSAAPCTTASGCPTTVR